MVLYLNQLEKMFSWVLFFFLMLASSVSYAGLSDDEIVPGSVNIPRPDLTLHRLRGHHRFIPRSAVQHHDPTIQNVTAQDFHEGGQQLDRPNMQFQYEDAHINAILRAAIAQLLLREEIIIMPPLGPTTDQLVEHLNQERDAPGGRRTLLIPYNIGNWHWVGIVIRYNAQNHLERITYIESVPEGIPMPDEIRAILMAIYIAVGEQDVANKIEEKIGLIQTDGRACGAVVVQNLLYEAQGMLVQGVADPNLTAEIRMQHVRFLQLVRPDFNTEGMLKTGDGIDASPVSTIEIPEIEVNFDTADFIYNYNREYGQTLGVIINPRDSLGSVEACWQALFKLRDLYKVQNDELNYYGTVASRNN
jgi:hypothetical protein